MINIKKFDQIYFYRPHVDFRKGINGLCAIVQDQMQLDPFGKFIFLFSNSKQNKIKALYWDKTGFAMWLKYLEGEKFRWPGHLDDEVFEVNVKNLENFLKGLNPWQIPHREKDYKYI
jgi:transposase